MEEITKSKKNVYSYLTNEWHNPLKDQVVLHAIHIILNKPFEPKIKGVSPFYISSITSNLLREKGVIINPTYDIGSSGTTHRRWVCIFLPTPLDWRVVILRYTDMFSTPIHRLTHLDWIVTK